MWKYLDSREIRGICLGAPTDEGVGLIERFIGEWLAPRGCNLLVLLTRYGYQFESRPECAMPGALSKAGLVRLREECRRNNIKLVPKMNLLGHQSGKTADSFDGLLRGHPEFNETPGMDEVFYCRSLCPNHPDIKPVVFDLMDELVEACEADAMHVGLDEVFDIGLCDRCKGTPAADIFAGWVNALAGHLRGNGKRMYMWGDRLLSADATGYGKWEASENGTEGAIDKIPKDIFICDWHYDDLGAYKSIEIFQEKGFDYAACPWRIKDNAARFLKYAEAHGGSHLKGFIATTWLSPVEIASHMLGIQKSGSEIVQTLAPALDEIFS